MRLRLLGLAATLIIILELTACATTPLPPPAKSLPAGSSPEPSPKTPIEPAQERLIPTAFSTLPGWSKDDLRDAWPAFLLSCDVLVKKTDWKEPCMIARDVDGKNEKAIRLFFESFFVPYQIVGQNGADGGLVTGYYEPLLRGARKRGGTYQTPLHKVPNDLLTIDLASVYPELKGMRLKGKMEGNKVLPYPSRAELAHSNALAGRELLWVDNPVEAFFLQVQGSGRVQLADTKEIVRVAYADQNGHPYKSIGRYLVDKGELTLEQASAQSIKAWVAANPSRMEELLNANPSYVFFREEKLSDPSQGPKGALGVPLTPQRSIAVDPQSVPLGVPIFLATTQPGQDTPLQRLVMAQDTGGAIKGVGRADYFWGYGVEAGEKAGKMKQRSRMWLVMPKLAR